MWHLKTTTMSVIGIIKKDTDKQINKIHEKPSLHEIQKIALCETGHLLRKILSM